MDCQFSFGPNSSYFVKSDSFYAWSDHTLPESLRRLLEDPTHPHHCQLPYDVALAMEPGVYSICWKSKNNQDLVEADFLGPNYTKLAAFIQDLSANTVFGPNRSYFSTTKTGLSWQNLPPQLETLVMSRIRTARPFTMALGMAESYAVLFDDGMLSHDLKNLYPELHALVTSPQELKDRGSVTHIALSPFVAGQFFVSFGNGSAQFNLPNEWHNDVRTVCQTLRPLAPKAQPPSDPNGMLLESAKFQQSMHNFRAMNNVFYGTHYVL